MPLEVMLEPGALDSDALYEMVNGERKEITPMGALAGFLASSLSHLMQAFAAGSQLGVVVVEVLFRLRKDGLQRRPDIAFVSFERCPNPETALAGDPAAWDVVPNLGVEVVSPTNTAEEIDTKIQEYFEAGIQLVWVVYPRQKRVHVYDSPSQCRILTKNDALDGGMVLPGFHVSLSDLFGS